MNAADRIERAAQLLVGLRQPGARPVSLPPELHPADASEAYAIQARVLASLGESIGGWKVSMDAAGGGSYAPVLRSVLFPSPARAGSVIADGLGLEPEVAFRIGRDLGPLPGGRAYGPADLPEAIATVHAAIEILVSRYQSHAGADPIDRLADFISNAGLIYGPGCTSWQALDFTGLPLRMTIIGIDGQPPVQVSGGGHPQGDPRLPLLWLINDAARRGEPLRAGTLVTTGSYAGLRAATPGSQVRVGFGGLAPVELEVT